MKFKVTKKSERPARMDGKCFYCHAAIGSFHEDDCVCIKKKVKIRMIVEYEITQAASWDREMIEFQRNDGSWCADNALIELENINGEDGCICDIAQFYYVCDTSKPFLSE